MRLEPVEVFEVFEILFSHLNHSFLTLLPTCGLQAKPLIVSMCQTRLKKLLEKHGQKPCFCCELPDIQPR